MKTHHILIHENHKEKSDHITIPTKEKWKKVSVTFCNIRQNILDLKKNRGKKAITKDLVHNNGQKELKCDLREEEFSQEGNFKKQINSVHYEKHDDSITKIDESTLFPHT